MGFSSWTFYWHSYQNRRAPKSVGSIEDLRTGGHWFKPPAQPIYFRRIDGCHCNWIHSFSAVHCFDHGYVGKQQVAWKEFCAEEYM